MAINKEDRSKINYNGEPEYFKERKYRVREPSKPTDREYMPAADNVDAWDLRRKFRDLNKKADKLDKVIDDASMALSIPIDKEKQPRVSEGVAQLDPASGGESLSYSLYKDILSQQEAAQDNITMDWLSENMTDDVQANSDILYNKYIEGAKSYTSLGRIETPRAEGPGAPNQAGVYANMMLNNITNWNENEYYIRQIVGWAQGYLHSNPDPAYIPWTFKEDVRRKIGEYKSIDGLMGSYTDLAGQTGTAATSLSNPLRLPRDFWDSLNGKGDSDNNFFNQINEIFSMSYGPDLICCLVAWAGGLDLKTLYALRLALQLMANGLQLELSNLFNSLISVVNSFFRNIITGQLIALLDLIFQTITDPIYKWLNSNDEKWRKLFLCTPINELVNIYVLGGIEKIEDLLTNKILQFWKQVEIDTYFEGSKTGNLKKNKQLHDLSKILDIIIASVGKSSLCGQEMSPTGDEVSRFMDAYKLGPTWSYEYEEEENPNEFNSFVRTTSELREAPAIDPVTGMATGETNIEEVQVARFDTGTAGLEQEKANISECLKKVQGEDIFSVPEWMEDMRVREES